MTVLKPKQQEETLTEPDVIETANAMNMEFEDRSAMLLDQMQLFAYNNKMALNLNK